jgi:hypothetical protein
MSNALGVIPSVMINRLSDRAGTPIEASLTKVAELRMHLQAALDEEQAEAEQLSPTGETSPLPLTSGAVVDRLI